MKRREFSKQVLAQAAVAGLGLAAAGTARAQAPVEGRHYVKLSSAAPVTLPSPDKKIEVVEFFWYGCPHCNAFEPAIEAWAKRIAPDVAFRQVPVGFSPMHQMHQKLYYALEETGQLHALHRKVFAAMHLQGKRLLSEKEIVEFVGASGGDAAKFQAAFKGFGVNTKATRARQLSEAYKIDGVPTLGVQGRYYTGGALAGSNEAALAVVDHLIQKVRSGG